MKFLVQKSTQAYLAPKNSAPVRFQIPDFMIHSRHNRQLDRNHITIHSLSRPPSALLAVFLLPIPGPGPGI